MTLVAVWRAENRLMAVADTRFVRSDDYSVLTEHGPKILPLTIRGRCPGESEFFDREAFQFDVGFAYSGATLPALSTHALCNALLGNLVGIDNRPPSLHEITEFIRNICVGYIREIGCISENRALFTSVVFGFCHSTKRFKGFEIKPCLKSSPLTCNIIEHSLEFDSPAIIIGSCPDLLRQRIEADRQASMARGDTNPVFHMDRPARALQSLIDEGNEPSIGGTIQQGWATPAGFKIVGKLIPKTPVPPSPRNAGIFVLGFDIMDMQQIGQNSIALDGG